MIKSDSQYRLTQTKIEQFKLTLRTLSSDKQPSARVKIQQDAVTSQITDLEDELRIYETLKSGHFPLNAPETVRELRMALIQARIARDMSYKELADQTGLPAQEIQRYEETDYDSVYLSKMKKIASALGIESQLLEAASHEATLQEVVRRLVSAGLDSQFVVRRLLFHQTSFATTLSGELKTALAYEAASVTSRVFGWRMNDILDIKGETLTPVVPRVRFKMAASAARRRVHAYAAYARYLSLLVAEACAHLPPASIPTDPLVLRRSVIAAHGSFTLRTLVKYLWELGVPVLGLDDPGAFHGACFREKGRNVIVLKQRSVSESRWTFDLLHALWHAAQEPDQPERTVLAYGNETITEENGFIEERQAGQFAGAALLKGQGNQLVERCLEEAHYDLRQLKGAVARIAARENVRTADLANYTASRLMERKQNWWGAAASLQPGTDPWDTVREVFFDKFDFSCISEPDRGFLAQAVSPWESTAHV